MALQFVGTPLKYSEYNNISTQEGEAFNIASFKDRLRP